jgi:hypothetical protein
MRLLASSKHQSLLISTVPLPTVQVQDLEQKKSQDRENLCLPDRVSQVFEGGIHPGNPWAPGPPKLGDGFPPTQP